ncbi:MAG: ATP-dependent DNA ligase [Betaproteobacteria bacterium]
MLAKIAEELPQAGDWLYEPKWDGFRALIFRGADDVYIQSRDCRPFDRYFPDLHESLLERLPPGCVVDGEIIIATSKGLDFDALQLRLHPAASRVERLAKEMPASVVAFDLLAVDGKSVMDRKQSERRAVLEKLLAKAEPPLHLTPVTRDADVARDWLERFEGAGLDGVIAKPAGAPYQPGKRAMLKIKHARTADCALIGFRWHKSGEGIVGSLLLGLYDDAGDLHHVGVASAFPTAMRKQLAGELEPLRKGAGDPIQGESSRWSAGRDTTWHRLRIERVLEVKYDHLQGERFRHAALFQRWRPDRKPRDCTYAQLETTPAFELSKVLRA